MNNIYQDFKKALKQYELPEEKFIISLVANYVLLLDPDNKFSVFKAAEIVKNSLHLTFSNITNNLDKIQE